MASALTLDQSAETAKLTFEISAPVEAEAFVLARPDRAVIDLPEIEFDLDPRLGHPAHPAAVHRRRAGESHKLVSSFRFGWLGQGKSRIVIDLGAPARIASVRCEPRASAGCNLVIELARTDRASFRAAAQRPRVGLAETPEAAPPPAPLADQGKPVVVVDPGHGGLDAGAIVNGLTEKRLVLDFARALAAKLESDGRLAVVMTRVEDRFVPLAERVKMARQSNALLFVSVHADTLSAAKDVAGATVYTVSERASDSEAERLAAKENEADAAAGFESAADANDVSDILNDLTRRETRAMSHVFARTLLNYWRVSGRLNKNPQRSAGFRVLMAPDVPSVLIELGYLSNEKDDLALSSEEWRDKTSGAVAQAILAFLTSREGAAAVSTADGKTASSGGPEGDR